MTLPVTKGARITQVAYGVVAVVSLPVLALLAGPDNFNGPMAFWMLIVLPACGIGIFFNDYASKHRDDPARVRRMWLILTAVPAALTARRMYDEHQERERHQRHMDRLAYHKATTDMWAPGGPGWGPAQGKGPR